VSELDLVPFRTHVLTTIKPLDAALIQVDAIDEMPARDYVEASDQLAKIEILHVLKIGLPAYVLGAVAFIVAVMHDVFVQDFAVTLGGLHFAATTLISRWLMLRRSGEEPFLRLRERVDSTKKRWLDGMALRRLTGDSLQASALRQEIELFNADIESLDFADCTAEEISLIDQKRRGLILRIGEFLKERPEARDIPEQKLLPEKIAS
jgi:hypothetical protein